MQPEPREGTSSDSTTFFSSEKKGAMVDLDVPPPPQPVGEPRQRKRCPHDYSSKHNCPICPPCTGGHGKVKNRCPLCNPCTKHPGKSKWACGACTVAEQDLSLEKHADITFEGKSQTIIFKEPPPAAKRGEKCPHIYSVNGEVRSYSRKGHCRICSNAKGPEEREHEKLKHNCKICSDCGHGKLARYCIICKPCPVHPKSLRWQCGHCERDREFKKSGEVGCGHGTFAKWCVICEPCPKHPATAQGLCTTCHLEAYEVRKAAKREQETVVE